MGLLYWASRLTCLGMGLAWGDVLGLCTSQINEPDLGRFLMISQPRSSLAQYGYNGLWLGPDFQASYINGLGSHNFQTLVLSDQAHCRLMLFRKSLNRKKILSCKIICWILFLLITILSLHIGEFWFSSAICRFCCVPLPSLDKGEFWFSSDLCRFCYVPLPSLDKGGFILLEVDSKKLAKLYFRLYSQEK